MAPKKTLWPLEPHTRGKHLVLQRYLEAWYPTLGTWNGRILFIDGFAGPGQYEGGEPGSPVIALETFLKHQSIKKITAEVVFGFVESDARRVKHLAGVLEPILKTLPKNCKVEIEHGKFDETMTTTLETLEADNSRLAPAFIMLDPFGVSDTPLAVIERILRNPRSEVYVSFMYEAINRFKETPEFERHLDALFGCPDWRKGIDIENPEERKAFFYSLYASQLRRAGAKHVIRFDLYEGNRLVYAIFFGTQHIKGADLIKQAIWRVAPFGDFAFHGTNSTQLVLTANPDFQPLRRALRREFQGKGWLNIRAVEEFVSSDKTDYYAGQLRKGALIAMEEREQIEVDPNSRNRRRTYPSGTRLRFR